MPLDPLPKPSFRPRKKHLWHILDVAVIVGIFYATGQVYMDKRGTKVFASKESERRAAQEEGARGLMQADSVVTVTAQQLEAMLADSIQSLGELRQKGADLESGIQRRQSLNAQIFPLSENVLSLKDRSQEAASQASGYERDLRNREVEIDSLRAKSARLEKQLQETRQLRAQVAQELYQAQTQETYDPTGMFPEKTGLEVRQQVSDKVDQLTNVEIQQILWTPGRVDVGVAAGVGIGGGESSNKALGLLVTRPLIHRRLGLDLGAGYSVLTEEQGEDERGAYASAGLRISPFYKERIHFGVGARATHGEVMPFLGVTVGRR